MVQSRKKNRKNKDKNESSVGNFNELGTEVEYGSDKQNANSSQSKTRGKIKSSKVSREVDAGTGLKTCKSKKVKKKKKKDLISSDNAKSILESGGGKLGEVYQIASGDEDCSKGMKSKSKKVKKNKKDPISSENGESILESGGAKLGEVYQIASGDEDCSKGMKKWVMEYHQSRPGLKILQQRIDEFIIAHEAQQEQERIEKEARAAEGGWTVVVHHKGRKKTTDSESGITVGSVAQAAVEDKMAKKKRKDVGLDFYRFQRREAKRNEVMLLQSKFEQDRKRIQQLRAARKFRPY